MTDLYWEMEGEVLGCSVGGVIPFQSSRFQELMGRPERSLPLAPKSNSEQDIRGVFKSLPGCGVSKLSQLQRQG